MVEGLYERYELSKFVSSSTVKSLRNDQQGQKLPLAILFSDIRSFTSYTEMHPPEVVVEHLNKILNFQTGIIQENHGDIDKYVGDEIVAFFSENNPELAACRTALRIQQELADNSDLLYDNLNVGIGINYGEVILGTIGSEKRADFTIIGDNVNLTARLCQVAKPGGWVWIMKDAVSGQETIFKSDMCIKCHTGANEKHPYGDNNNPEEFLDYVYYPYHP